MGCPDQTARIDHEAHDFRSSNANLQFDIWCSGYSTRDQWLDKLDKDSPWYLQDSVLVGRCSKCWQHLLLTEDDCWHPFSIFAPCPYEPSNPEELAKLYAAGHRTLRPGIEFFEPMPDPVYLIVGTDATVGNAFYLGQYITKDEASYYGQDPRMGVDRPDTMHGKIFYARLMIPPNKEK